MNKHLAIERRPAVREVPVSLLRQRLHRLLIEKMNRAGWQTAYLPAVVAMKRQFLTRYCGVSSSKDLDSAMCDYAIEQLRGISIAEPQWPVHQRPTVDQRKKIVRLGKYRLAPVYGEAWFWKKLPEWIHEYHQDEIDPATGIDLSKRRVTSINMMTRAEAWYIIQRLEKVEARLEEERRLDHPRRRK